MRSDHGRFPRGLPASPATDRLAIEVVFHDLDQLTYGDADKPIADAVWWEEYERDVRRILFTLRGEGVDRRYALIRTDADWRWISRRIRSEVIDDLGRRFSNATVPIRRSEMAGLGRPRMSFSTERVDDAR